MSLAEQANLAVNLMYRDQLSAGMPRTLGNLRKLDSTAGRIGAGAGKIASGLANVGTKLAIAGGTGLLAAAKIGSDFEAQLNTINTVAQVSQDRLKSIGDGIRKLSRETGTTTGDLTQAYYDLVSAGISAADSQGVLEQANKLAIGGLSTTSEAVDLLTTAINSYGGDASKAAEYTNQFAEAIGAGKVTASEIAASFANVGPLAAKFGTGVDEISAALGVMTAKGTPAAEVFTQMRAAIKLLEKPTKELNSLSKATGHNYEKIAKKSGIVAAYQQMEKDAKKAGTSVLALSGRMEAALFSASLTGDSFDDYNAELEKVRHSSDGAGVAAEQMAQRQKGLAFQVGRLQANLKDAALELSAGFLPAMTRTIDKLVKTLDDPDTRSNLKAMGEDIGRAIDEIDWKQVLDGVKTFSEVLKVSLTYARGLFDILNTLPTEVKAAGLGALATNKLSGGLIFSGLGDIFGGLGGALAKSFVANLPGIGKAFVQPVFVTNMGPGGMGGGGGIPGAAGGIAAFAIGTAASGIALAGALAIADKVFNEPGRQGGAAKNIDETKQLIGGGNPEAIRAAINNLSTMPERLDPLQRALYDLNANGVKTHTEDLITALQTELPKAIASAATESSREGRKGNAFGGGGKVEVPELKRGLEDNKAAIRETARETSKGAALTSGKIGQAQLAIDGAKRATEYGTSATTGAVAGAAGRISAAVAAARPIITTNVKVNVSAAGVSKSVSQQSRYGPGNGSSGRYAGKDLGKLI